MKIRVTTILNVLLLLIGLHFWASILPQFITLWYHQRITPTLNVFIICHIAVFLLQSRTIINSDENFPQKFILNKCRVNSLVN